ncbi:nitroreductase family protein [Paenibacillus sp. JCM 10914]|uniref:nitroreductase family protein n=1 Tax=Paenibacillus sp. JCM 10914 TaxID=1236974 RepID=UPI0003CC8D88|nr:nitroreductase family protein [Paenibacillus sp. JCM 10914]GAE07752.1 nitroreductase family protein [Paenibacillus sp. JCM 10914]
MTKPDPSVIVTKSLAAEVEHIRQPGYPVHAHFVNRWSSRSFASRPVEEEVLFTVLEAARWAPSSGNGQPWRFVVARTQAERERFQTFILPGNRGWSDHAPALILLISYNLNAKGEPSGSHAFDAGTAWGTIAAQAALLGLNTRALGGFDREAARQALGIPVEYDLHAVIALGYRGDPSSLPDSLRERDIPTGRLPLNELVHNGVFGAQE